MRREWKGLTAAVLVLLLLSGCAGGEHDGQMQAEAEAEAEASVESWGAVIEATSTPSSTATPSPSPSPSPSAEPTPTPEPQPESLRELVPDRAAVWIDGEELEGLVLAGTTLIKEEDLARVRPGFHWLTTTEESGYFACDIGGESYALECTWVDGRDYPLENYTGEGGIWYMRELAEEYAGEYWVPVRWAAELYGMRVLWDGEQNTVYLTSGVDTEDIPLGYGVPILMYHAVSDDLWGINELFVSPEEMRKQLEYLLEQGYDPIFFSDLPNLDDYDKPILLTFDDGYDDNYTQLFPLLQEFGVKATVFVITGALGDEHYITAEQAREMSDSGLVDIQSHTVDHCELATLSAEEQAYQLSQSRLELARITGKIPYVLAYPSGSRNGDTIDLAMEYYDFGVDMNGGTWYPQSDETDFYKVDRIYISRWDSISDFAAKVP